jgi:GMP synthase-like glutamine amidotransferase
VRVLSIVHERDAGPGVFAAAAAARGDEVVEWIPAEGQPPRLDGFGAILVFGGGMHVDHEAVHPWLAPEKQLLRDLAAAGTPMLGVCLGAQLLAEAVGGSARRAARPEIGWTEVELTAEAAKDPLLGPLPSRFASFQWHSYEFALPQEAVPLARSAACIQAFRRDAMWGIQFHAEVTADTVAAWISDYGGDDDATAAGLDAAAVLAQTASEIERWNEIGAGICARFLDRARGGDHSGVT